ncbi:MULTISPECIES: methyltransferase domain-containing protein [Streptomyces]|uniref:methyltransferase domain-containing protein n=1 Tax=Streptomyces TaxID=1883 RepID=UPI00163BEFD0|nr:MULTISPECIES: methyltransferase domain-containing protein [Streptomyces]MBC2878821.1 methyltransferase domain-containing protein [Streptomyces sp. TYQ1024]UBI39263.1 methyltransferase domain-containing protein [Streptomyces mobaraensis]UKW31844.1 methyltransferase domain-containing protein [Streptomyces sp. TYQ1024]
MTVEAKEYVFDPAWERETERLRTNEAIWDPGTVERLERLGVGEGWSVLEVGAGSGSIAHWLGERVGPSGRVVAADLSTERLGWLEAPHVEVARVDIRSGALPADTFDLVHSRMVIQHLEDREGAVAALVRTLKPGGWLFLEDTDSLTLFRSAVSEDFLQDVRVAGYDLMRRSGHEPRGGHFDVAAALAAGLEDVSAEGRAVLVRGGSVQARHYMLWLEFMRPRIVAEGRVSGERIDEALREMADPAHRWLSQVLISTFGRKGTGRR